MLRGVDILANAVRITLGPKGRNVILEKSYGAPRSTKDGVTVAKEIELEDRFENMGAQMVREVAQKTNDMAGDGTTTATVLAHSILREGMKSVAAGMNPMDLKRGIEKAVAQVVEEIQKKSKKVKDTAEIAQVGHCGRQRGEGDRRHDRQSHAEGRQRGRDHGRGSEEPRSELEVVEGMQFDRGYLSPYFITNVDKMTVELAGGVAVIKVGGATEVEVKERKDRVDDALNATRAAVEEGIVPGGGVMLLKAARAITIKGDNEDQDAGINIVRKALQSPIRQIAENAGVEGSIVVGKVMDERSGSFGYDAQADEYGDMIEKGIIDPAKVVRIALQDAASIAGLMITTEAGVAEAPKKEAVHSDHGQAGMGGMM